MDPDPIDVALERFAKKYPAVIPPKIWARISGRIDLNDEAVVRKVAESKEARSVTSSEEL